MQLFVGAKGLVHHNGKVLLLRESSKYLDGAELGKWDVPGGRINSEETLREGLVREVKEESGLDVEPGEILGAFDGFPMIRGEKCHVARIYFACEAKNTEVALSDDHDAFDWIDPKDVEGKELVNDIAEILEIFRKKP
jgi:8-oxo-dGTP diphosphatase